ncbi:MAG: YggS family pyridoxal phosphate-dependent enzyme [Candidatus Geothermincolia bacterium]
MDGGGATSLAHRLRAVEERIAAAAARAKRDVSDVRLIAVSKNQTVERMREAMECGITSFGENRAREFADKYEELGAGLQWHFIGHLQTNKVQLVVGRAGLIHGVDSWRLARLLSDRAISVGIIQDILLQVNVSGEESKSGFGPDELASGIGMIAGMRGLRLKGLMTIAPLAAAGEAARPFFSSLRRLRDGMEKELGMELDSLSMGMTGDYEVAIEEGATLVRIGTGIFGPAPERMAGSAR